MKAAQIELTNYFVAELQFAANRDFDAEKPSNIGVDDIQVVNHAEPKAETPRDWQITLRVALNPPPDRNSPYSFLLEMIGFVHICDTVLDENVDRFARITGTSLVFGAAREIVRAVTSRGPFRPILLPTVTFWEAKPKPAQTELSLEADPELSVAEDKDK